MNAIQKEYAVKELKNEIKENLKRKFYKFFFVIKALVTLLLFILFEYLIIAFIINSPIIFLTDMPAHYVLL